MHPRTPTAVEVGRSALLAFLLAFLALPGCSQPGRVDAATPPDDFVLGVTVFQLPARTPSAAPSPGSLPRSKRPARYIVEADGVLRASLGAAASPSVFPLQTRQLNPEQIQQLWTLTQSTGVFDGAGEPVGSVASYEPPYGRITALIEAFAAGRRGYAAFSLDHDPAEDQPAPEGVLLLTDALADLAWLPQQPVDIGRELRARETLVAPAPSGSSR